MSNTPIIRTHSIFFPFRSSNETGGTDSCRSGDRKNVGKTGNKICTTFKRPVSEYPFPSHQKRRGISSSGQFEKLELVHPIRTLQNGRSISFERNSPEERLYVQDRFKGRLFCSSPLFKLPETYQVEMERECLSVSMPLLWLKFSSKGIHKTNEDPNFRLAEIECKTDIPR